ncbi:hypothetical protein Pla8534_35250 [Lignipirellula cremea]|uniref:Uncharacterized protein n=1 Tax=Lignipirellula cremea TaxID=2528010 RepID=A0A518DV48_9BACT|nr:hypothetical protein Pla8534_35250 [Lignipirellula cremea]
MALDKAAVAAVLAQALATVAAITELGKAQRADQLKFETERLAAVAPVQKEIFAARLATVRQLADSVLLDRVSALQSEVAHQARVRNAQVDGLASLVAAQAQFNMVMASKNLLDFVDVEPQRYANAKFFDFINLEYLSQNWRLILQNIDVVKEVASYLYGVADGLTSGALSAVATSLNIDTSSKAKSAIPTLALTQASHFCSMRTIAGDCICRYAMRRRMSIGLKSFCGGSGDSLGSGGIRPNWAARSSSRVENGAI